MDASAFKSSKTICWDCENATGFCSWSRELKPVPGWEARQEVFRNYTRENDYTYTVLKCPEFVKG